MTTTTAAAISASSQLPLVNMPNAAPVFSTYWNTNQPGIMSIWCDGAPRPMADTIQSLVNWSAIRISAARASNGSTARNRAARGIGGRATTAPESTAAGAGSPAAFDVAGGLRTSTLGRAF